MKLNPILEKIILLQCLFREQKFLLNIHTDKLEFVESWKDEDAHKIHDYLVKEMMPKPGEFIHGVTT